MKWIKKLFKKHISIDYNHIKHTCILCENTNSLTYYIIEDYDELHKSLQPVCYKCTNLYLDSIINH
jgi:hypothetical protein